MATQAGACIYRRASFGNHQSRYVVGSRAKTALEKEFGFKAILKMLELFKTRASLTEALKQALNRTPDLFDQQFNAYIDSLYARSTAHNASEPATASVSIVVLINGCRSAAGAAVPVGPATVTSA